MYVMFSASKISMDLFVLLGTALLQLTVAQECLQGSTLDFPNVNRPATEDLFYVNPQINLQHVIVPELRFNCYGYITSWSALTVIDSSNNLLQFLNYQITFTLWRPRNDGSDSSYDLVGINDLSFEKEDFTSDRVTPIDNSTGLAPNRYSYFTFQNKAPIKNQNISFQPGDVIGWNVERSQEFLGAGIIGPVSVVFRRRTQEDQGSVNVLHVAYENATRFTRCSIQYCDRISREESVLPYLTVNYVETSRDLESVNDVSTCIDRDQECPVITTAMDQSTTTVPSVVCGSDGCSNASSGSVPVMYVIIGGAAGGAVILGCLIVTVIAFICIMKMKNLQKDSFQDNPTYESADRALEGGNGTGIPIDESEYATADEVRPQKLREVSDTVECYASTYSSNGEAHLYQELPDKKGMSKAESHVGKGGAVVAAASGMQRSLARTGSNQRAEPEGAVQSRVAWPEPALKSRGQTMSLSREAVGPKSRHDPLRTTFSLTSRFSESNLLTSQSQGVPPPLHERPPPYSEVIKNPQKPVETTPYLVSRPSVSSSLMNMSSRPRTSTSSRPRLMTSLQNIPDETSSPVWVDEDAIQMHRLYHTKDDEVFRVPSANERLELEGMDSADQVYSRLNYPNCKMSCGSMDHDNSDPYWEPSSTQSELYDQLARRNYREIHRSYITTTDYIGGGHFGKVHRGLQKVPGGEMEVAIKTLNPNSSEDDEMKFLKEAAIMGQFLHPNVIKLLGVVTVGRPLMIVLELMPEGDLAQYLVKLCYLPTPKQGNLPTLLLGFCRQIGYGMNYLANKGFVHRDLAARNILLTKDLTCKIGDFGMARDLEQDNVYVSQGGKMPLKWTAPESIKYHQFSSASDVWSYGMLLFEIWSLGKNPFEGLAMKKFLELVYTGYCQPPPPGCPKAIYTLMVQCWHTRPEERPNFSNICTYLNSSPDEALLHWDSNEADMHSQAAQLGAPLSEARKLYLELQYIYNTV